MLNRRALAIGLIAILLCLPALAQNGAEKDLLDRIRQEEKNNSQIMKTMHMLTDVYGPRLTGSRNHKAAAEWAVAEMKKWGFDSGQLEPWDFGHPGWLNERLTAHVVSPVKDALVGEALAWTNGTNGPVRAAVTHLVLPERPTAAELTAYLEGKAAAVAGRIVMVGAGTPVPVNFTKP